VNTASAALAALGMDLEEVVEMDSVLRTRPAQRDGRICLCGHGIMKHSEFGGHVNCKPSKMDCPCKRIRPVIDVEDTRPFLRKTQGAGPMHALARGLAALAVSGKEAEWIVDLVCDRCEEESSILYPVPVTQSGFASTEATGYDALLCPTCREAV
jgi:hypothetical protein